MSNTSNLYQTLSARTIVSRVAKYMIPHGFWYIDPKTFKITHQPMLLWDMPWVSTANEKRNPDKHCGLLKTVMFECFHLHPQFCREVCHKLVIHPLTFHDLWKLYSIQYNLQYESKCGIEVGRPYVPYAYGGYFYCYSMQEAWDKRDEIQKLVDKNFRKPVKIELKRGCTEMEDKFGPSSEWKPLEQQFLDAEEGIASFFDFPSECVPYPEHYKPDIMIKWFKKAEEIGDRTVREFNLNRPLIDLDIDYY